MTAKVWPNHTVFLDFFNEDAKEIWARGLKDLHEQVPFDGLWLDMNEATLFCNGECPEGSDSYQNATPYSDNSWYHMFEDQSVESTYSLPFIPGIWNLDNMTLSLNATHPQSGQRQYDTHSLFGHMEAKATHEFLRGSLNVSQPQKLEGKRTFLLSRSTFAGSGAYTQHWLGDNHRTWADMQTSIAGVMNFNMFGIPVVGPDTCGFFGEAGNVTQELCARWIQLATFYPFAR